MAGAPEPTVALQTLVDHELYVMARYPLARHDGVVWWSAYICSTLHEQLVTGRHSVAAKQLRYLKHRKARSMPIRPHVGFADVMGSVMHYVRVPSGTYRHPKSANGLEAETGKDQMQRGASIHYSPASTQERELSWRCGWCC